MSFDPQKWAQHKAALGSFKNDLVPPPPAKKEPEKQPIEKPKAEKIAAISPPVDFDSAVDE